MKTGSKHKFFIFITSMFFIIDVSTAQNTLSIKANDQTAHVRTIYKIEFTAAEEISPNAVFEIIFPKSFLLTNNIFSGSNTLNGGLDTEVRSDTVIVTRSGLGKAIPVGNKVDIMLSDIINPGKEKEDYEIIINIRTDKASLKTRTNKALVAVKPKGSLR